MHPQIQHLGTGLSGAKRCPLPPHPSGSLPTCCSPFSLVAPPPPRIPGRSRRPARGLLPPELIPHCSPYTLRTDARDRFGTPLEQRFTRSQIRAMCTAAGLVDLRFSTRAPYWCVVGVRQKA